MFTGIVEEVGTIKSISRGQHSAVLTVRAKTVLEETRIGDSIAVNGICLTVRQLFPDSFAADVMHETLNRSALAQLTVGSAVNLERAMPAIVPPWPPSAPATGSIWSEPWPPTAASADIL